MGFGQLNDSDSELSQSESDGSLSSTDSEENDTSNEKQEENEINGDDEEQNIQYEDVELDPSALPLSPAVLEDDDVELWLFRIPTHEPLLDEIVGKSIRVHDGSSSAPRQTDGKIGDLKGGYSFRDHGVQGTELMRASFVVNDAHGNPQLRMSSLPSLSFLLFACIPCHFLLS